MKILVQAQVIKKIYDSLYDDLRKKYGLTMNEIMFLLSLNKHQMNNTAREIVEELMATKSHISKSVASLAQKNIIVRIPDTCDKKIIHLFISQTAEELLNDLKQREKLLSRVITKGISDDDWKTFEFVLKQMQKNCMEQFHQNFEI